MEGERKKTEEERDARKKYLDQAHGRGEQRGGRGGEGMNQEEREGRHRQREETLAVKDKEKEVEAIKVCGGWGHQGMGWVGPSKYGVGGAINVLVSIKVRYGKLM